MSTKIVTAEQAAAIIKGGTPAVRTTGNETPDRLEHLGKRKVRSTYVWRAHKDAPKNTKTSTFDFSTVSDEQLIELAMYAVKVHVQAVLRNAANAQPDKPVDPKLLSDVNVLTDVVLAQAIKADPIAVAIGKLRAAGASEATVKLVAAELRSKK
jgi:hypothetical protein